MKESVKYTEEKGNSAFECLLSDIAHTVRGSLAIISNELFYAKETGDVSALSTALKECHEIKKYFEKLCTDPPLRDCFELQNALSSVFKNNSYLDIQIKENFLFESAQRKAITKLINVLKKLFSRNKEIEIKARFLTIDKGLECTISIKQNANEIIKETVKEQSFFYVLNALFKIQDNDLALIDLLSINRDLFLKKITYNGSWIDLILLIKKNRRG